METGIGQTQWNMGQARTHLEEDPLTSYVEWLVGLV